MSTELVYYKVDGGILVANAKMNYSSRCSLPANCKVNGQLLRATHNGAWYFVAGSDIVSYEVKDHDKSVVDHYVLKDISMEIEGKIPLKLLPEDVCEYYDDVGGYCWKNHSGLQPLYTRISRMVEGEYRDAEFTSKYMGEVSGDITKPLETKYKLAEKRGVNESKEVEYSIATLVHYSELEKILTPEFILHTKPCSITSEQTYKIIRSFVKDNIDPKHAEITSDYDFCFTVKKKIAVKPWVKKIERKKSNGRSYAKPKIKTMTVEHKSVEVFEMTYSGRGGNYSSYTPIKGFSGDTLEDLVDNIKNYLEELITYLNRPAKECVSCGGTGHHVDMTFKMNFREDNV